jgi:hypothetical protein
MAANVRSDRPPVPEPRDRSHTNRARDWSPAQRLTLPRSPTRQALQLDRARYTLRDSEVDILATVGTFRVIPVRDLSRPDEATSGETSRTDTDLRSLRDQGSLRRTPSSSTGSQQPWPC